MLKPGIKFIDGQRNLILFRTNGVACCAGLHNYGVYPLSDREYDDVLRTLYEGKGLEERLDLLRHLRNQELCAKCGESYPIPLP